MARNSLAKTVIDTDTKTVTFTFTGRDPIQVAVGELPAEIQARLMVHGATQKLRDCYAGDTTVADAVADFNEVLTNLKSGKWGAERAAGEAGVALVVEALARIRNVAVADAQKLWDSRTDDQKTKIRANDQVKAMVATIQAERANARVKPEAATLDELFA